MYSYAFIVMSLVFVCKRKAIFLNANNNAKNRMFCYIGSSERRIPKCSEPIKKPDYAKCDINMRTLYHKIQAEELNGCKNKY